MTIEEQRRAFGGASVREVPGGLVELKVETGGVAHMTARQAQRFAYELAHAYWLASGAGPSREVPA